MIIYADILFLLNGIITYILLICTALIFKNPIKRLRILIACIIGGVYSFTILIDINIYINIFIKIGVCALMIYISFGFSGIRTFIFQIIIFILLNFLLAGIVLALSFFNKSDFYSNILVSYINISPIVLIISSIFAYLVVFGVSKFILSRTSKNKLVRIKLYINSKTYNLTGFCDSGNSLSEPFSALPVCIIKSGIIKEFDDISEKRIIPYNSIGGDGIMYAVKARIEFEYNHSLKSTDVYIAETPRSISDIKYDIILNPQIFY